MSSPKYEVIYFNGRGRAELTRQIFAAAGVEFKDTRMSGEEWQALKPKTPFGQLPLLKVDGEHVIAQSAAMARFAANVTGLAGDGAINQAKVDMISEVFGDLATHMVKVFVENDEAKKGELKQKAQEECDKAMDQLEKIAGDDYFVGGKLSAADILLNSFEQNPMLKTVKKSPRLSKIIENVRANPGIKAWIAKRPETEF